GILLNPILRCDFDVQSASEFNGFQANSLRNRTGNLQTRIREFFSRNREFDRGDAYEGAAKTSRTSIPGGSYYQRLYLTRLSWRILNCCYPIAANVPRIPPA